MPTNGITVYLPRYEKAKVQKKAADEHRSESSVIAEAVKAYFRRLDAPAGIQPPVNVEHLGRRLDARLDKAIGEGLILKEVVLLFIRVWLEHNPPIDEALEESMAASAEARFQRFLETVAQALRPGCSLSNGDLPQNLRYRSDDEIATS